MFDSVKKNDEHPGVRIREYNIITNRKQAVFMKKYWIESNLKLTNKTLCKMSKIKHYKKQN